MRRPFKRTTNQLAASLSAKRARLAPLNTPTHIFLEVTNRCNLSCVMCGRTHDRRYKDEGFTGDISLQTVRKLEPFFAASTFVTATGLGEPFLNPQMVPIVRYLKDAGARISMTSNGTILDETLARQCIDSGLDRIVFSIDSPVAETFERIRVGANLNQVLENIERFSKLRAGLGSTTPYMILEFVAMAQNIQQLPDVADLAARLEFNEVIVQNLFKTFEPGYNVFYQKNKLSSMDADQVVVAWDEFESRLKSHGIRLYSPFTNGGILSYVAQGKDAESSVGRGHRGFVGYIDSPGPEGHLSSPFPVSGWAMGGGGVPLARIRLESATDTREFDVRFDVDRPDVMPHLPADFPQRRQCGFDQEIALDGVAPGVYTLSLLVRESNGTPERTLARHQVVVGESRGHSMYCTQPWTTVYVTWDGKVRTCCFNEVEMGDLNRMSADQVWRGGAFTHFRSQVSGGQVIPECMDCLAGKSVPNYLRPFGGLFKF